MFFEGTKIQSPPGSAVVVLVAWLAIVFVAALAIDFLINTNAFVLGRQTQTIRKAVHKGEVGRLHYDLQRSLLPEVLQQSGIVGIDDRIRSTSQLACECNHVRDCLEITVSVVKVAEDAVHSSILHGTDLA